MRRNKFKRARKFEKLEDRQMMAADINLIEVDGVDVLAIQGTNNDDHITIMATTIIDDDDEEEGILVTIRERTYDGLDDGPVLQEAIFERDDIDELEVYALDGNDWIENWTDIRGTLDGGNHGDDIMGGLANDTIYGRSGSDRIAGGAGDNHLYGGADDDEYFYLFGSYLYPVIDAEARDVVYEDPSLDTDEISFEDFDGPINLDLASTAWQVVHPEHVTLQLSSATGIEDVHGSRFDDTIRGNSRDNRLSGYDGNDEVYGRTGNDRLFGGEDDDLLVGAEDNDTLEGGAGNDTYEFAGLNLGTDEIHEAGNVDTDTLDFSGFQSFVSVDLEALYSMSDPDFAVTAFMSNLKVKLFSSTGIEDVIGSPSTDTIRGNARPNHFWGGGEDDRLEGRGGNDILEGEAGSDTYIFSAGPVTFLGTDEIIEAANADNDGLDFKNFFLGLTIDLTKFGSNAAVNNSRLTLKLANDTAIERVWGSDYRDTIIGNGRDNYLYGRGGNDTITGGVGADHLYGGDDSDQLWTDALDAAYGGAGIDTFDQYNELLTVVNPRRGRYVDWRTF